MIEIFDHILCFIEVKKIVKPMVIAGCGFLEIDNV